MKKNKKGYMEEANHSNLWHRKVAYYKIYLKDRKKYPLPFSEYEIHHKDGNKLHNNPDNLELLSPEEHIDKHLEFERQNNEFKEKNKKEYDLTYNRLIKLISKKTGLSIKEINRKVEAKCIKLSGLISKARSAQIIASELGIDLED